MKTLLQIAGFSTEQAPTLRGNAAPKAGADTQISSLRVADSFAPGTPRLASMPSPSALGLVSKAQARIYYDAQVDKTERAAYYGTLEKEASYLDPQELYQRLSSLVTETHTRQLDYSPSTELYPWVDLHPDLKLRSIYSARPMDVEATILADLGYAAAQRLTLATAAAMSGPISLASLNATLALNCEHVVPQSWFERKSPMRGDLHHLFACDPGCNGLRGSVPYADQDGDLGSTCGKLSPSNDSFEPAGGHGPVARATLYFLLRYPGQIGNERGEYTKDDIATLIRWSKRDPVSQYELHRNAEIARRQGNRNPLIDHPEWVDRIDFTRGLGRA